ncbi:hypothetical protein BH09BAC1_BH09BAC1_00890 [soil metagenome]
MSYNYLKVLRGSFMLCLLLSFSFVAQSQTWIAAGASGNWSNPANWSPATVPGAASTAIFNGSSSANCIIDVVVSVNSIQLNAGYTGTVINTNFSITTGSYSQAAGNFNGGTGSISVGSSWLLSGGTFTSTSGSMTVTGGPFTLTGGTFNANNGRVVMAPLSSCVTMVISANITFCELEYKATGFPSCGYTFDATGSNIQVSCNFINSGGSALYYIGGVINLKGNITTNNTAAGGNYSASTTVFNISGPGTQTWTGAPCASPTLPSFSSGRIPNININKAATDTLVIYGVANVGRNYVYTSGVIKTIGFLSMVGDITVSGVPHTISRLAFSGGTVTVNASTILTTDTTLLFGYVNSIVNTGRIDVLGDIVLASLAIPTGSVTGGGNALINIIGTRPQTMYCNSALAAGTLPNVSINNNSLAITRSGYTYAPFPCINKVAGNNYASVAGNWTYLGGTITGDGIICFTFNGNQIINSHTLPNVVYHSSTGAEQTKTVVGGTLTVRDTLFTHGIGRLGLYGNTQVLGSMFSVNTGAPNAGTGTITFTGTGTHSFSSNYGAYPQPDGNTGFLPNITVNMPSGTLNIIDTHAIALNWVVVEGNVIGTTGSNVFLHNSTYNLDMQGAVSGTQSFYDLTLVGAVNRNLTGNVGVNGKLVLSTANIKLNNFKLSMNSNNPANLINTTGYVVSENQPAAGYGRFEWAIGNAAVGNSFVYPFGSTAGTYIPFNFEVTAQGTAGGKLAVATYPTDWTLLPNNTPFPTGVTNINNIIGTSNYARELDRYWIPEESGFTTNPTGKLTFTYRDVEWNLPQNNIIETRLEAHRWLPGTSAWQFANGTSIRNTVANTIIIPNQNVFTPFTIVDPQPPKLRISANDSTVCVGTPINFTDLNVPTPTSSVWYFPGSNTPTSTATNPTGITYSTTGCKDVILQATYPGGTLRDTFTCFITVANPPVATAGHTDITCNGLTNGKVWVTVTGASTGFTYTWGGTPSTQTNTPDSVRTGLGAGTYTIAVNDPASCATTVSATVIQPAVLTVTTTQVPISCNNGSNGQVTATPAGGNNTSYTYAWQKLVPLTTLGSTATITNLNAGSYRVTVTDASGCTATATEVLTNPASMGITLAKTDARCNGQASGKVWATVTGGTAPITYVWNPNTVTSPAGDTSYNQLPGTVSVTATDSRGCTVTGSIVVGQATAITVLKGQTNLACNAVANGKVWAKASNGTGPYTYAWSPGTVTGPTGDTLSGLLAGNHYLTTTDANGCIKLDTFVLTQPTAILAPITNTNVNCFGASTATLTVTPSGGPPPATYTYQWNRGVTPVGTTASITNQPAGTYTVTVTRGVCTVTATATVTEPASALAVTIASTPVTCFNGTNGTVTATATGGTVGTGYTYAWTKSPSTSLGTGATKTGLSAGTYIVTATDGNGCTATSTVTLANPAQLTITMGKQDVSCFGVCDGKAWATLAGGTTPYTYLWSNGGNTDTIRNLCPATYTVTATDANGCTVTGSATVGTPAAITTSFTQTNVTCFGGTNGGAILTAGGGPLAGSYTYVWSPNVSSTNTITNVGAGVYRVTVTKGVCSRVDSVTITQPTQIVATVTGTNVLCNGGSTGSATVTYTGGPGGAVTYVWTQDNGPFAQTTATITGLVAGTYAVTVTTSTGSCTGTGSIIITEPSALTATITGVDPNCNNGTAGSSVTVTPAGGTPGTGYTYNWTRNNNPIVPNPTTNTVTGQGAGNYSVTITDANGCILVKTQTLNNPAPIGLQMTSTNSSCFSNCDGTAGVLANGGTTPYTYLWSNGITTANLTGLCPGRYKVTVTDSRGCFNVDSVDITAPAKILITVTPTNVSCFGGTNGSASAAVTGGPSSTYSYVWQTALGVAVPGSTNSATVSNLTAGNYRAIVTSGPCSDTAAFTITQPTQIVATVTGTNVLCNGGSNGTATVTYTGGPTPGNPTYQWARNTAPIAPTTASITGLTAGTYEVTVTINTCTATGSITITEPTAITSTITGTDPACNGGTTGSSVTVSPSGGTPAAGGVYTYTWRLDGSPIVPNPTGPTVTNQGAGLYSVTITDANGCTATNTFTLNNPPATVLVMNKTNATCFGLCDGTADVAASGGTPGYTYLWSNGSTGASITGLCPGRYKVTVTDSRNCTKIDSVDIVAPAEIVIVVTPTNVTCFGGTNGSASAAVTGGPTTPYSYVWQTAAGAAVPGSTNSSTVSNLTAGNYQVIVTSGVCADTATFTITQPTEIITNITGTNVACFGASTGSATVTYTGGPTANPGFPTYTWQKNFLPYTGTGSTTNTITGLAAGTYSVVVNINSCLAFDTIIITEPTQLTSTITGTDPACNGGTAGSSVTVTPSGGTPATGGVYTYNWTLGGSSITPPNSGATVTGLGAGIYVVTITDASNCTATNTFTLNNPPAIVIVKDSLNVKCFGDANGKAWVTVSGGTPGTPTPYTIGWSGGVVVAPGDTITNLLAGTYTVSVTDGRGCVATETFVIKQPLALGVTLRADSVSCFGGSDGKVWATGVGGAGGYTYDWTPPANPPAFLSGPNGDTINNVEALIYTVTVVDDSSCTTQGSITVQQPTQLVVTMDSTNVSCFGGNNGKAWVTVTGGRPGYTYAWSGGTPAGNGDTIKVLTAGTYYVTVTDAKGCRALDTVIITQPATALTLVMDSTNVRCFGQTNGKAWVTATGGTPILGSYDYAWSGGTPIGLRDTIINLPVGTYTVTVTDANGCSAVGSVKITQPNLLTLTKDSINVQCFGESTGKAWVTIAGGTVPYNNVVWTGAGTTSGPLNDTLNGLVAGTYTAAVTDANGCTTTVSFNITEPTILVLNMFSEDVNCFGDATGKAWVVVTGGTPGTNPRYTYAWSGGTPAGVGDTIRGLIAGPYTVTVTDANGCTSTKSVTINQPAAALAVVMDSMNIACFGQATGKAWATVTGGTVPYTYTWSGGTPSTSPDTIINLLAGVYTVTITDNLGCQAVGSVNIVEPPLLTVDLDSFDVTCNGLSTGSAWANVSGGTPGFTFAWSGGTPVGLGDTIINLPAGPYTVTVTDLMGCNVTKTIVVNEPTPLVLDMDSINVSCNGANDGRAWVTASGANPPYTYAWSGGAPTNATGDTIANLTPGIYVVTVTDKFNCTQIDAITIDEPNLLLGNIRAVNVRCFGGNTGRAWVTAVGGNGGYRYVWSGGTPTNATGDTIGGLTIGRYKVTITDSRGCTFVDSIDVTQPAQLVSTMDSIDVLCFGQSTGRAWVAVTGGLAPYDYVWSGGTPVGDGDTVRNLAAGNYFVTITDDTGCVLIDNVTINQPATPVTLVKDSTNILCFGDSTGRASVIASGGTLTAGGTYTYIWSRGNVQGNGSSVTGLTYGVVQVTVTDNNGCEARASFNITQPTQLISATNKQNVKCFGENTGKAWVTVSGGKTPYNYVWSGGTPTGTGDTVQNLIAGSYFVTITDANGCNKTDSVTITEPLAPLTLTLDTVGVKCFGGNTGRAWATVTGGTPLGTVGYTYNWSAGTPFGAGDSTLNLPAGPVSVTVTDANNCSISGTITVNQPATALAIVMDSVDVTCFGACNGKAWVTASGGTSGYTYTWANSGATTDTISSLCPGNYVVTVTDAKGCRAIDLVSVNEPDELLLTIAVDSSAYCNGNGHGQVTVKLTGGTGPYVYAWSNGSPLPPSASTSNTITNVNAGLYTVTVTDANGCNKMITVDVLERSGPKVTNTDITATICNQPNGVITLTVTTTDPSLDFDWSHDATLNSATAAGLASGSYTVTVSDASTCDTVITVFVPAIDKPVVDSVIVKDSYCSNMDGSASVQVSAGVAPYVFTWSHDSTLVGNIAKGLSEGSYDVTVTDANGCDTSFTFNIEEIIAPKLAVVPNVPQNIYAGQSVNIAVSLVSPIDSVYYQWVESEGLDCYDCTNVIATPERTTTYLVMVTDVFTGCQDTAYVTVIVKDETNIFIPTAITPNGDGVNDVWKIRELVTFPDNEVVILNRWGDVVFSASPYQNDFNGTFNGKELPAGTYYYIIKLDNISESVTGPLTIVK